MNVFNMSIVSRKTGAKKGVPHDKLANGYAHKSWWYCQVCGDERNSEEVPTLFDTQCMTGKLKICRHCKDAIDKGEVWIMNKLNYWLEH